VSKPASKGPIRPGWIPVACFALALALSALAGPARSFARRVPGDSTGQCTTSHKVEKFTATSSGFSVTVTDVELFHVNTDALSNSESIFGILFLHGTFRYVKNGTVQTHTNRKLVVVPLDHTFTMPVAGTLNDDVIPIPHDFKGSRDDLETALQGSAKVPDGFSLVSAFLEGPQSMKVDFTSTFTCTDNSGGTSSSTAGLETNMIVDEGGDTKKPAQATNNGK
jgi:hypothetical protein